MSLVKMKVQQLIDLDLWDKVLEYKGWNHYILNEGRIDYDDLVEFDSEFKKDEFVKKIQFSYRPDIAGAREHTEVYKYDYEPTREELQNDFNEWMMNFADFGITEIDNEE